MTRNIFRAVVAVALFGFAAVYFPWDYPGARETIAFVVLASGIARVVFRL